MSRRPIKRQEQVAATRRGVVQQVEPIPKQALQPQESRRSAPGFARDPRRKEKKSTTRWAKRRRQAGIW